MKKILAVLMMFSTTAYAEPQTLIDYLASINNTEVKVSGKISYVDKRHQFISDDATFFVNIDSGRDDRNYIEEKCESSDWNFSYKCDLEGVATIEIDKGNIELSIHSITNLKQTD